MDPYFLGSELLSMNNFPWYSVRRIVAKTELVRVTAPCHEKQFLFQSQVVLQVKSGVNWPSGFKRDINWQWVQCPWQFAFEIFTKFIPLTQGHIQTNVYNFQKKISREIFMVPSAQTQLIRIFRCREKSSVSVVLKLIYLPWLLYLIVNLDLKQTNKIFPLSGRCYKWNLVPTGAVASDWKSFDSKNNLPFKDWHFQAVIYLRFTIPANLKQLNYENSNNVSGND